MVRERIEKRYNKGENFLYKNVIRVLIIFLVFLYFISFESLAVDTKEITIKYLDENGNFNNFRDSK